MNFSNDLDIAIVGIACRVPGADTCDQFWRNLSAGVESITRFSDEELLAAGVPSSALRDPRYVKAAPVLDQPGAFDADFFRYSPMEVQTMDPQHRILLELAYHALEDAGYDVERYNGQIGIFTGSALNTYFLNSGTQEHLAEDYIPTLIGVDKDFLATRIAYKLDLKGPSVTIQTACSTSMVAVHLARQSLLCHETDMVLAGGISVRVPHRAGYWFDGGGVVSPDGRVRAFDAGANGTVFGSGGGVLVLKRLADAIADGDTIYAVIKGSAVNNDGAEKAGYTAPSVKGQADAVLEALANADVDAESISYVETHGSGTPVGDPVEMHALTRAFRNFTQRSGYCAIGSVKTNVGHLDAAAAVTGIIKTVLALKHRKIPPSLNFTQPNPEIDFPNTPFFVNTTLREWTSNGPRRAGVMSTGMGGTNAHLILEEAPPQASVERVSRKPQVFVISAKTEPALVQATERLHAYLDTNPSASMADAAYTLQIGRKAFPYRRYAVCASREEALASFSKKDDKKLLTGRIDDSVRRPVVMLLPGVGDHYVGMGHQLYEDWEIFRTEVDRCAEMLAPEVGLDIRTLLYPTAGKWKTVAPKRGIDLRKLLGHATATENDVESTNLNRTRYVHPALFTVEYALAKLWESLGITADAIVGHSMGEYVAACLAEVLSLEDALCLVAKRAKLVDELPQGRMLAVILSEQDLLSLLSPELSISLINGPSLCVVAGPTDAVDELERQLQGRGVICRPVQNAHAFHSRMMIPVVDAFKSEVVKVRLKEPKLPFISNVSGNWITPTQATDPNYWAQQMTAPARFNDGLQQLWQVKDAILLEAGPGRTLGVLAMQHPGRKSAKEPVVVSSLRHGYEDRSDVQLLCDSIGKLWLCGAQIRWEGLARDTSRRIPLPTYPFERKNYWYESHRTAGQQPPVSVPPPSSLENWFYVPTWERETQLEAAIDNSSLPDGDWLIIDNRQGDGVSLRRRLETLGIKAALVTNGDAFRQRGNGSFELDLTVQGDYVKLLRKLYANTPSCLNIIHLGSFIRNNKITLESLRSDQTFGFYSVLYLAQALGEVGLSVPVKIAVISNQLHQVTGEEVPDPRMATVLGPCGVVRKEFPHSDCFNIDLPEGRKVTSWPQEWLSAILSDFVDPPRDGVAYRGQFRWKRQYRKVQLPQSQSLSSSENALNPGRLRHGGVYLITGGTGGIGLSIAKYLAKACQPKLVLTKKASFPEKSKWAELQKNRNAPESVLKVLDELLALQAMGAEVEVRVAECADPEQMKSVLSESVKQFGTINGVIHAAGVVRPGLIEGKNREDMEAVLGPKVYGTMILFELLKGMQPDFLVLFSSMQSILSPIAVCDYSAANSFLDAAAWYGNAQLGLRTLTINWPGWKEVGQLVNLETLPGGERWKEDALNRAILASDGVEAFRRALESGFTQVLVSPENLDDLLRETETSDSAAYPLPSPRESNAFVSERKTSDLPTDEVESAVADIWSRTFGIDSIGVHDNFFEIGGHSLLAARIVSRVERRFGKRLSIAAIFRAPTIAQLAATIRGAAAPHVIPFHASTVERNPLFWFGGWAIFNPLAQQLANDPPMVYITLPDDVLSTFSPPYNMEEVARCMVEKIVEVQPEGPHYLGGWCLQGLLAYETARQLELQGRGESLVVLVDTPMPKHYAGPTALTRLKLRAKRELFHLRRLWTMPAEHRFSYLRGRFETLKMLLQVHRWRMAYNAPNGEESKDPILDEILFLASLGYHPEPFSGRMLFLQPELRPPDQYWDFDLDWTTLVKDLAVFEAPGDHVSMFHDPNVSILAERIRTATHEMRAVAEARKPVAKVAVRSTAVADKLRSS